MLTDRGTEFCGRESHEYELHLAVEDVDHSRTKAKTPIRAVLRPLATLSEIGWSRAKAAGGRSNTDLEYEVGPAKCRQSQ